MINPQFPPLIDGHNLVVVNNLGEDKPRRQHLAPRTQKYYRENVNITDYDGPLFKPPLPQGYTFVVTSSLMQILTTRGLFFGLSSEDPHAHISKVRSVCKSYVGRSD